MALSPLRATVMHLCTEHRCLLPQAHRLASRKARITAVPQFYRNPSRMVVCVLQAHFIAGHAAWQLAELLEAMQPNA